MVLKPGIEDAPTGSFVGTTNDETLFSLASSLSLIQPLTCISFRTDLFLFVSIMEMLKKEEIPPGL